MTAVLCRPATGEQRVIPTGFSWTTLFFGPFPALFRGDFLWAIVIAVTQFFTVGIAGFIWAFAYNGIHHRKLLKQGFGSAGMGGGAYGGQQHVNLHINDSRGARVGH